jgi:hypothetical protein
MKRRPTSNDSGPDDRDTKLVKILITDDQLARSWDVFPTESAESDAAEPAATLEILNPEQVQRASPLTVQGNRWWAPQSALRPALGLVGAFLLIALVNRSGMLRRTEVPVPSEDVSARVTTTPGTLAATVSEPSSVSNQRTVGAQAGTVPAQARDFGSTKASRRSGTAVRSTNAVVASRRPARASQVGPVAAAAPIPATAPRPDPVTEPPLQLEESPGALAPPAPAPVASVERPSPESGLSPEMRAIAAVLNRYQQAFSRLDASAAQAVWPSVDVKALGKAFDQLDQQTFDLEACDITTIGARAEAECTGNARYIRKVGNRVVRVEPRQWRFTLRQINEEWVIETVDAR